VVDDETVRRRRLVEMTEDERAEYDSMDEEESRFADKFLSDAIRNYVTVEADQLFEDGPDGEQRQITAGADLLRVFGGRADVLSQLLRAVHYENCLSAAAKKALRLVSDSARSSVEHAKEAAGLSREPTAAAAGTSASAGTAGATGEATSPSSSSSDGAAPATEAS
jgi:hypothetical protein